MKAVGKACECRSGDGLAVTLVLEEAARSPFDVAITTTRTHRLKLVETAGELLAERPMLIHLPAP